MIVTYMEISSMIQSNLPDGNRLTDAGRLVVAKEVDGSLGLV